MTWKIEIKKVDNGYICKMNCGEGVYEKAIEQSEKFDTEEETEQDCMRRLLYEVMNFFAVFNSKHNKTRLEVNIIEQKKDDEE